MKRLGGLFGVELVAIVRAGDGDGGLDGLKRQRSVAGGCVCGGGGVCVGMIE
jgi:hypothetical protein